MSPFGKPRTHYNLAYFIAICCVFLNAFEILFSGSRLKRLALIFINVLLFLSVCKTKKKMTYMGSDKIYMFDHPEKKTEIAVPPKR